MKKTKYVFCLIFVWVVYIQGYFIPLWCYGNPDKDGTASTTDR